MWGQVSVNSVRADPVGAANRLGNAVADRVARNFCDDM